MQIPIVLTGHQDPHCHYLQVLWGCSWIRSSAGKTPSTMPCRKGWVMQYCRVVKPSRGVSAKYMRWFYITVAVPRMLHATDLFLIPESTNSKGMKGYIAKLGKIQRKASLHIMGEMRS